MSNTAPFPQRLDPATFREAQARVARRLVDERLDAILTDDPKDIAYLTGFFHHPSERPVAVWIDRDARCVMVLPELEREYAASQRAAAEIVAFPEYPGVIPPFRPLAGAVGAGSRRTGFTISMSYERQSSAHAEIGGEFVPTNIVMQERYIKSDAEIALHAEAGRITDLMLQAGIELVREAVSARGELPSEAELAAHVSRTGRDIMYREHREVVVASLIAGGLVYTGDNSSYPHGLPSSRRLAPGDTFMLSLGCAVGGRFIEGERTFVLGEPTDIQRHYHDTVREAQRVGGEVLRPGLECREANAACLAIIREAGLGEFIRHRQGHGIGLGMHEAPWLEDGDPTPLQAGMVVSNEPGIYVPGHAGYRISDSMLITKDGARSLTGHPRDLDSCTVEL